VALAHDWLVGMRGGERVLEALAGLLLGRGARPTLYTMFDDGTPHASAIDSLDRRVSPLDRVPGGSGRARRWMLPAYPLGVRALSRRLALDHARDPIGLVVSTSSAAIKGLGAPVGVPHLCYCHSPARYAWSQGSEYGPTWTARGLGLRAVGPWFRRWDRRTASNVTRFVANSTHTAQEVRRCYGREARVVHPPVRTGYFTLDHTVEREGFWLYAGALEPYKRVDLAIEAAKRAGVELVVVGDGSDRERIRQHGACARVRMLGRVEDVVLRDLYRRAKLLIMPQIEDFGIVAVEAQACGCPVLARGSGGALDTVVESETGALFDTPDPESVVLASGRVPQGNDSRIREHAERFGEGAFVRGIEREIRLLAPWALGMDACEDEPRPVHT